MLEKETLNDKIEVKGYEGLYSVTQDGRIWSHINGKWLKPGDSGTGYKFVILYKDGIKTKCPVHRLVAKTFSDNPEGKLQVNHIDGDKTNNHINNLEWVNQSENNQHAWDIGLRKSSEAHKQSARKTGFNNRMFSDSEVYYIRKMCKEFNFSQATTAKFFQTSIQNIHNIVNYKTYSEVA